MKKYMRLADYCEESGFRVWTMRQLCRSYLGEEFSQRAGSGDKAPIIINTQKFERMWDRGDFQEVLK